MERASVNPHGFEEYKLNHETNQKNFDRRLEFEAEVRQRVDTLVKTLFVLCGGALSVAIGIFLRPDAPAMAVNQGCALRLALGLNFYALLSMSTLMASMICQGYWQMSMWQYSAESELHKKKTRNWLWRISIPFNWLIGLSGFVAFLVGMGMLGYVSVQAVKI